MRRLLPRSVRRWPRGTGAVSASAFGAVGLATAAVYCDVAPRSRFQELPPSVADQAVKPAVPSPGWDNNWDKCEPRPKDIAKQLGHEWPITDWEAVIRQLYTEHSDRKPEKVDEIIKANRDDLPGLYTRAFVQYAWGGAVTRHIILVRHGQYDEQRQLSKELHAQSPHRFGMAGDTKCTELDERRVLTELGKRQAIKAGDRLAEMLKPALTTPGREAQVRIHVSTLTRAKETADLIASRLPPHVWRVPPDPNLSEGSVAHKIPFEDRGGEDMLLRSARDVHVDNPRVEAAFRSLFYRDQPCKPCKADKDVPCSDKKKKGPPRHEYEIVVGHQNVIRYFVMRALQLPPEAWLRMSGFNGAVTYLKVRPSGNVSLVAFGDFGHMSPEETTFGMRTGVES